MKQLMTLLTLCGLAFASFVACGQTISGGPEASESYYKNNSPLDFLRSVRQNFRKENLLSVFTMTSSPENWIREEHIPELIKLIYSTDSIPSIANELSSYLTFQPSSIGREAQNLIHAFRLKSSYPSGTSYGPPDQEQGKEIERWWAKYKSGNKED
ncbi:MAG TPA: hypothetical protein PKM91_11140 [Cyclobacteriaceae bacterium]|jgi:hypothetical protein|nr:hypothetical protein [Cyclobacteriaceae bacterium]